MRGGTLPPAILCGALGLALAFTERRAALIGVAALAASATTTSFAPLPASWADPVFLACWTSVIVNAASVHSPRGLELRTAAALSLNAGLWVGAVIALSPSKMDLAKALPWSLCAIPANWVNKRGISIVIKVVSSWLIAVALLAAALEFLSVTPGYLPDHMD
jgi:hypothetical protein